MARIWLLADAFADIEAARQWYETQRAGLGEEFIAAVDEALESVLAFPTAYPVDYRDARRFLVERFPYCMYYRVQDSGVVVACMHAARDPEKTRKRLRRG